MNGRPWTKEEDQYLRENYPDGDTRQICRDLDRSKTAVYGRVQKLDLNKSEEAKRKYGCYLRGDEGIDYRFNKGHTPANKGKKMTAEQYARVKHTFFPKGNIPKNHKPVGTIAERTNYKRGRAYLYIKIAEPGIWVHLHRYNWEKVHGPVPKGMNLVFKDGNYRNCQVDNLELITREENMRRNTIHNRYPEDLKKAILTLGALKRKVREHEERNN